MSKPCETCTESPPCSVKILYLHEDDLDTIVYCSEYNKKELRKCKKA